MKENRCQGWILEAKALKSRNQKASMVTSTSIWRLAHSVNIRKAPKMGLQLRSMLLRLQPESRRTLHWLFDQMEMLRISHKNFRKLKVDFWPQSTQIIWFARKIRPMDLEEILLLRSMSLAIKVGRGQVPKTPIITIHPKTWVTSSHGL